MSLPSFQHGLSRHERDRFWCSVGSTPGLRHFSRRYDSGLSLIEVLVALAIVVVVGFALLEARMLTCRMERQATRSWRMRLAVESLITAQHLGLSPTNSMFVPEQYAVTSDTVDAPLGTNMFAGTLWTIAPRDGGQPVGRVIIREGQ